MKKLPKDLDSFAFLALSRMGRGQRVEVNQWVSTNARATLNALVDGGYATSTSTPGGRKRWLEITPKGRALLPAIHERECRRQQAQQAEIARIHAEDMLRAAAPDLLAVADVVIAWYENSGPTDPDAKSAGSVDLYNMARAAVAEARVL